MPQFWQEVSANHSMYGRCCAFISPKFTLYDIPLFFDRRGYPLRTGSLPTPLYPVQFGRGVSRGKQCPQFKTH